MSGLTEWLSKSCGFQRCLVRAPSGTTICQIAINDNRWNRTDTELLCPVCNMGIIHIKNRNFTGFTGISFSHLNGLFTGDIDLASGLPIARHPRGAGEHNEECEVDVECEVGWKIKAVPGEAKFLYHAGVNGDDHPVWMVNRVDIPQKGSFTHFHWITPDSSDPRGDDPLFPAQCDVEMAGQLDNNAEDIVCPGWFLEIKADDKFAFQHGNEVVPVSKGIDNATHLNLVTNYEPNLIITPTRSSSEH